MTPLEITALVEQGLELIAKTVELIRSAQKGELSSHEARDRLVDFTFEMQKAVDEVHNYLDQQYVDTKNDKGEKP